MATDEVKKQLDELVELNKQLLAQNEEVKAANADLKKQLDAAIKKDEDGMSCKLEDGSDGVMKDGACVAKVDKAALPEAVRKQMDAQAEEIKKQADEIAKMRDRDETREYVAKAQGFTNLPTTADVLGAVLKAAKSMPEAQRNELDRILKAVDASMGELTKMKGSKSDGNANSAYEKLMGIAKELRKEDPKMSIEKAFTAACESNNDLYREHRAEQRGH